MKKMFKQMHKIFFPSGKNDYQPLMLRPRNLFVLAIILLVAKFVLFSWFFYFPGTPEFAVVTGAKLIELVNNERIVNGLKPLKVSDKLSQAAEGKAQDMLENSYFAHTSPTGITPWYWLDKNNYNYVAAGENLAKDFTDSEYVHKAWMNSPSHKANIMNENYQEIGIAVVEGEINGKKTLLAVQFFGKVPSKKTAPKTETQLNVGIASTIPKTTETKPSEIVSNIQEPEQKEIKGEDIVVSKDLIDSAKETANENETILNNVTQKSEPFTQKIYFVIAGLLSMVLLLTVFVNIRVQYPRLIFTSIIFVVLIGGLACFNGQAFLNKGIDLVDGASVQRIIQ
jgi:hypothetical protein